MSAVNAPDEQPTKPENDAAAERRQGPRLTINKQFPSFDDFVREYVTNVSGSGAFVRTDSPLPIGTEVNLKFSVVLEDDRATHARGVCPSCARASIARARHLYVAMPT